MTEKNSKDLPELIEVAEVATILMSLSLAVGTFGIPKNVNAAIAFRLMANIALGNSVLGNDPNIDSRKLYDEVVKEIEFLKRDMK